MILFFFGRGFQLDTCKTICSLWCLNQRDEKNGNLSTWLFVYDSTDVSGWSHLVADCPATEPNIRADWRSAVALLPANHWIFMHSLTFVWADGTDRTNSLPSRSCQLIKFVPVPFILFWLIGDAHCSCPIRQRPCLLGFIVCWLVHFLAPTCNYEGDWGVSEG